MNLKPKLRKRLHVIARIWEVRTGISILISISNGGLITFADA